MKKFSVRKKILYNPKKPVEKESVKSGKNPSKKTVQTEKIPIEQFLRDPGKIFTAFRNRFFGTDPGTEPGQILPVPARAGTH
jgi:hypothetical protein